MAYLNGKKIYSPIQATIEMQGKVNILDNHPVSFGNYYYVYDADYAVQTSTANRYHFDLIELEKGKVYELYAPNVEYAVLYVEKVGSVEGGYSYKFRLDSGWLTNTRFLFVATTSHIAIQFKTNNNIYEPYASLFKLCKSDYVATEIEIDFDVSKWEHLGLAYSGGRTFADAKSMDSHTDRFRYNFLIPVSTKPLLFINTTTYQIAVQQYDADEKGRADTGWFQYYKNMALWQPNIALTGSASSSISISSIVSALQANLHIYIIDTVD